MDETPIVKKIVLIVCAIVAVASVVALIMEIKISKSFNDFKNVVAAQSQTESFSWYEENNNNDEIITFTIPQTQNSIGNAQSTEAASLDNTYNNSQGSNHYILNKNSKKIHSQDCKFAQSIKQNNRVDITTDDLSQLFNDGYTVCSNCKAGQ